MTGRLGRTATTTGAGSLARGRRRRSPRREAHAVIALTVRQPWASRIIAGRACEHRSWAPPPGLVGQRIAIHAATQLHAVATAADRELPRGAVIGTVRLVGVHELTRAEKRRAGVRGRAEMARPRYVWLLADPKPLPAPVPARGKLRMWTWEG